jgi:phage gp29-like protein
MGADISDTSAADLHRIFIKRRLPQSERFRSFFGREADMNTIKTVIRQAEEGYLVQLTDFCSEVLGLEPHLSAILAKRFGSVQCLEWDLVPPTGPDVDKAEAKLILEKVKQDFDRVPHFSERLYDLMWANYDGRAALEIEWQHTQSRFPERIADLRWIHPRRMTYGPRRELRIIDPQRSVGNFQPVGLAIDELPGKFVHWTPRMFREYPEREGLAPRTLYWAFFKRFSWRQRMILTELFAVPWRIIEQDPAALASTGINKEGVSEGFDAAEKLGQESTAELDPGQKISVVQPEGNSHELFGLTHDQVNAEMSKLVLGNVGTTENDANRANSIVQKSEQDIILQRDARGLSERIDQHMVIPTVFWNFGPDSLVNAPRFVLQAEPARDMQKDQERADKAIMVGVPVAVTQYRELTGLREPEDDEPFVVGTGDGATAKTVDPAAPEAELSPKDPLDPGESERETPEQGGNEEAAKQAVADLVGLVAQQLADRAGGPGSAPFRW